MQGSNSNLPAIRTIKTLKRITLKEAENLPYLDNDPCYTEKNAMIL